MYWMWYWRLCSASCIKVCVFLIDFVNGPLNTYRDMGTNQTSILVFGGGWLKENIWPHPSFPFCWNKQKSDQLLIIFLPTAVTWSLALPLTYHTFLHPHFSLSFKHLHIFMPIPALTQKVSLSLHSSSCPGSAKSVKKSLDQGNHSLTSFRVPGRSSCLFKPSRSSLECERKAAN